MRLLENPIRGYAWGSRTALAALQGRSAPTREPEAELWIGAHPDSPSAVGGTPLTEVIAGDPAGVLGAGPVARFGERLPFLLKVLAAAEPLSLQAHPTEEQAAAGFAAEEAAGKPREAADRNYRDPHHKPELLVALEPFEALSGFRAPAATANLLAGLEVAGLAPTIAALRGADPGAALRHAVTGLMELGGAERKALVEDIVAAARGRSGYELAVALGERYPGDIGVVVALLLNQVRLAPGEAIWLPAGNLHAYLRGTGVEIMAASDNVLRGGLTPKHVDVPELLRVLRFEVLADPVVRPREVAPGLVSWPVPVDEFVLHRADLDGGEVTLPGHGPRVVLCLRGEVRVDDGAGELVLTGGQAAFGAAGHTATVSGTGQVYQATTA
ncbi:mannose-6-phosphate isomerase, class I [Planosporangium flavigriseum]|uniref:mannose-6-phosphate isomerase n=1 Tax=Planosporangium flavigriseum TaxID=373681 RepID=A0A8J3LLG1_9ACTN|nr:mannose-6-phosphate isomerase, class I [Planosporangium flavigriseum]NJC64940.1 mannose-6-phosphate isomerase, class I [Planosporangium flavigriseum]GIG72815.1 putative mannose-6-phosphate isomerase ManA [Planosporangium flavigriseum]